MDELRHQIGKIKSIMKSIIAGILILAGAVGSARGETVRTDINPALRYWEAFMLVQNVPKADRDELTTNEWRGRKMSAHIGELLARYDQAFRLLRAAAKAQVPCDWGLDMSEGPELLLPQLAQAKAMAITARLRVMWDLQNNRQAEARDDLLAALALARNATRDGTLISVLVQIAMENILLSTVAENFYQFSPETLKQLDDGFAAAPARGTVAQAIATGERSFADWFMRKVQDAREEHPGNDAAAMASLHTLFDKILVSGDNAANDLVESFFKASGGTTEGLLKLIGELPPLYDRLHQIMSLPITEYEPRIAQLNAEVQTSSNPLVTELFPAITKSRPKEFLALGKIAMLHAAVEYKFNGEAAFNQVIDPLADGSFTLERFTFNGVDRGFKLKSPYNGWVGQNGTTIQQALIFVEKDGPPFLVSGVHIGEAAPKE